MEDEQDDDRERVPDELTEAVRREQRRRKLADEFRDQPTTEKLKIAGSIGWLIVVPTVGGIFVGQWLDARGGTEAVWTLSLLFLGLVCGSYMAWRYIRGVLRGE
ncbi:MAG: AtpZ/AtpI family protein [Bradymonadaceae bacterium]